MQPSIFARMAALPPSVTRFRRTRGVWPILNELSSKIRKSDLQVQHILILLLVPAAEKFRECGAVDNGRDGFVYLLPHFGEGGLRFAPRALPPGLRSVDKAQHFAHGNRIGRARQQVASFGAAALALTRPDLNATLGSAYSAVVLAATAILTIGSLRYIL